LRKDLVEIIENCCMILTKIAFMKILFFIKAMKCIILVPFVNKLI